MGAVYSRLSLQERRRIEDSWLAKVPVADLARFLKQYKSTIFREIKRNFWTDDAFSKQYAGYFGIASSAYANAFAPAMQSCLDTEIRSSANSE